MAALPDPTSARVSRRSLIGLGLAGAGSLAGVSLVAGCSSESDTSGANPEGEAGVTPDVRTATAALAAIRGTHEAVRATAQRFPATRSSLSALTDLHRTHERSLVDAVPAQVRAATPPTAYAVPRRREVALARLRTSEDRLHDTLQALALKAESGEFARLLASMAAGVSVHLPALSRAAAT